MRHPGRGSRRHGSDGPKNRPRSGRARRSRQATRTTRPAPWARRLKLRRCPRLPGCDPLRHPSSFPPPTARCLGPAGRARGRGREPEILQSINRFRLLSTARGVPRCLLDVMHLARLYGRRARTCECAALAACRLPAFLPRPAGIV